MARGSVLVVIQARTGSSRLPGKVLADLGGRPMLRFQLDRLAGLPRDHLVVATTDRGTDDPVAELAGSAGVEVVRGPEQDVLGRFGMVIDAFPADTVVRLTGDCPLSDPHVIGDVIELHHRSGAAYTSNVHPRSFPRGLDVEAAKTTALATAVEEAIDDYDREHVTPFLYRNPERFVMANLDSGEPLGDLSWTVDTSDDLAHLREIVASLPDPVNAGWREILEVPEARRVSG